MIGHKGDVFELKIEVMRLGGPNWSNGAVTVVELSKLLRGYTPGRDLHAVYEERTESGNYVLRNSWGTTHQYIQIPKRTEHGIHSSYYVRVVTLIHKGYGKRGDVTYCDGGRWIRTS